MRKMAKGYVDCDYLPGVSCDCNHQINKGKCPSARAGSIVCIAKGEKVGANRAHASTLIIKAMNGGKYQTATA